MTYATASEVDDYLFEAQINPPEQGPTPELIERAERDVDRVIGGPLPEGAALRLDPALLTDSQRTALARAVGAQVEYRLLSGETSFAESEDVSGPDLTVISRWTRIGPKVAEELAGHGLIRRSGTAAPSPVLPVSES